MQTTDSLERPSCWEKLRAEGEEASEDEMAVWHHQGNGHGLGDALGDGKGQEDLGCGSPWGHNGPDMIG